MAIYRIYPEKSNTIASGTFSSLNSGQNAVSDLWYGGGGGDIAPEKRNSMSRLLLYFDLSDLEGKIADKEINADLVQNYKLNLTNSIPGDKVLEQEYEFSVLDKKIAASFDIVCFPINKYWDQGRGYDLIDEKFLVKQYGNPLISGTSNWINATEVVTWDEPGVYENPTGWTYSGEIIQSGMTISKRLLSSPDYFNFTTSANTTMSDGLITATTIGNNSFISFSGDSISTLNWYDALMLTSFSASGINVAGYNSTTYINSAGTESFIFSADTLDDNVKYYSTQHFDVGNENIELDVTDIVKDWLSGGSENYGLGIAFRRDYELVSGYTRYISSFYTENTNTAFKPYLEVEYNQNIRDDRKQVSNNRTSNLFLYTFSGHSPVNIAELSAVTVDIKQGSTNIYTGLTPTHLSKGVYYVNVWMSGTTPGQMYKDVWNNVSFSSYDNQNIEQDFQIQKNYYTGTSPDINEYSLDFYGIDNGATVRQDENIRVFCDLRVNYSILDPATSYDLEYQILMNNQIEVSPWTEVNQAVRNGCKSNFFDLDASWLLTNQTYQIFFRIREMGTNRVLPNNIEFKVLKPF